MAELLSISEAAAELGVSVSRARALASSGALDARKLGGRWVVESRDVAKRRRLPIPAGRPFEPRNAWAVIFMAAELPADWLDTSSRWRLRQSLRAGGLAQLLPRLVRRSQNRFFDVDPSGLTHLLNDERVVRSGISAAAEYELALISSGEFDGYVRASDLVPIVHAYGLLGTTPPEANVLLRVVPDPAWHLENHAQAAPISAVALDLAADPDPRSGRMGRELLESLGGRLTR